MEKLINSTNLPDYKYIIIYIGVVIGAVGQQICLPLFIGSFNGLTGGYFVVFWCSILFNIFFWPVTFYRYKAGKINQKMHDYVYNKHYKLILIGVFDALNGILIVYSSSLNRTPGPLQAVLSSSVIPFTILLSKLILNSTYSIQQIQGSVLTILGILVSLIPNINDFGEIDSFQFIWPLIFIIGNIPGVLMNILEESIFQDMCEFDNILLLAWESLYQVLTVGFLFWTDIIPGFGTSESFSNFGLRFIDGLGCFFTPWLMEEEKCGFSALTGILFALAYCFSYIYGASLMKYASANSTAIISSISPVIVVFFWIIFSGLNKWAGGEEYNKLQKICYGIALPIIVIGIIIYRKSEKDKIESQVNEVKVMLDKNMSLTEKIMTIN